MWTSVIKRSMSVDYIDYYILHSENIYMIVISTWLQEENDRVQLGVLFYSLTGRKDQSVTDAALQDRLDVLL